MSLRSLSIPLGVSVTLLMAACNRTEEFDPGLMTEPPPLEEVIGTDRISRAKAEEVGFRCVRVPRPERKNNPWCKLEEEIAAEWRRSKKGNN